MIRKDCICFFNNLCLWDVLFRTACFVKGIVHNTFNFPNVRQTAIDVVPLHLMIMKTVVKSFV